MLALSISNSFWILMWTCCCIVLHCMYLYHVLIHNEYYLTVDYAYFFSIICHIKIIVSVCSIQVIYLYLVFSIEHSNFTIGQIEQITKDTIWLVDISIRILLWDQWNKLTSMKLFRSNDQQIHHHNFIFYIRMWLVISW